jgi:starvation-inducible outer membrane lipoprotein
MATVTYLRTADISNKGEVIMNRIQKATAAAIALTITIVGSVCVTAPLALADIHPAAVHQVVSVASADHNTTSVGVRHS